MKKTVTPNYSHAANKLRAQSFNLSAFRRDLGLA